MKVRNGLNCVLCTQLGFCTAMDTKMEQSMVLAVCLLLYIPSVLNLPLVPKHVLNLEQTQSASDESVQNLPGNNVETKFVQYVKHSLNSGIIPHSENLQNNDAQPVANLPNSLGTNQEPPPLSTAHSESSQTSENNQQPIPSSEPKQHSNPSLNRTKQTADNLKYSASQNSSDSENSASKLSADGHHQTEFKKIKDNPTNLQLAVNSDLSAKGQGHRESSEMILTVGTGLAALFSLGLVVGVFSCCCPKKAASEDHIELKEEKPATPDKPLSETQKPSQMFNSRYSINTEFPRFNPFSEKRKTCIYKSRGECSIFLLIP